MHCYVYKGKNKEEHYLYLDYDIHQLAPENCRIPDALLEMLGELQLVVEFELTDERKLPNADPQQVIHDIQQQGFYLQMPKQDLYLEEERVFN